VLGFSDRSGSARRPVREERTAGAEDHRDQVDHHLIDQPERERLAADLTGGHVEVPVARELLGGRNRLLDAVDERERRGVGVFPVRRRLMGDDEDVLAGGRLAVPALVRSNTRRPMTTAAMSAYWLSMKSAEAWVLPRRVGTREAPGDVAVAEPVEQRPDAVAVVGHERV
jgi:hypothetical protein